MISILRNKIFIENNEGNKTIDELQNRLKLNIESIQLLSHQVNSLQKENNLQKEELEKEITLRHTLQLQLESKNQLISSLTNECNHVIRKNSLHAQQQQHQHQVYANSGRGCSPSKQKLKIQVNE